MNGDIELTPEQRDQLLDRVAAEVVRRRLEAPAILFLELHRPLAFLSSQALIVFAPLLGAFFTPERIHQLAGLLQERENLDRLIERIEERAAAREQPPAAQGSSDA